MLLRSGLWGCLAPHGAAFGLCEHDSALASTAYRLVASGQTLFGSMPSPEDGFSVAPQSL